MFEYRYSLSEITFFGFVVSTLTALLFRSLSARSSLGMDRPSGIQKFHVFPTSRFGGVSIFLGLMAGTLLLRDPQAQTLAICAIPVFAGGLLEDATHRVGPNARLLLAIISATASYVWLGIGVRHTDIWLVDQVLMLPLATYLITILVVAGFTNGMNIIDGFHGLAAGSAAIMMMGFLLMAWQAQDLLLVNLCALSVACTTGFLLHNWPRGSIFLGDAGAYLLGFWVVQLGLLLVIRNPGISPMGPTLIGIYPLIETLFSIYRRKFLQNHPINHADALHLHTLIYRRLVVNPSRHLNQPLKNHANSKVARYFWLPAVGYCSFAVIFQANTLILLLAMFTYFCSYMWLYRRVIRFSAPEWMRSR